MFDRSQFWPAQPDWNTVRIEQSGLTVTARHRDAALYLVSGEEQAVMTFAEAPATADMLRIAPDKFLLVLPKGKTLGTGWHPSGVSVSTMHDAYVRFDITGDAAQAVLHVGSMTLAQLNGRPLAAAALGFAGITVLAQPLVTGCRIYVEHPQASYLWHWLLAISAQLSSIAREAHSS